VFLVLLKVWTEVFLEVAGPTGISFVLNYFASFVTRPQTGLMYHYALMLFIGVVSLLFLSFILSL